MTVRLRKEKRDQSVKVKENKTTKIMNIFTKTVKLNQSKVKSFTQIEKQQWKIVMFYMRLCVCVCVSLLLTHTKLPSIIFFP